MSTEIKKPAATVQLLHVFTNGVETYVAFDAVDAEKCHLKLVGEPREYPEDDPFIQTADDNLITLVIEESDFNALRDTPQQATVKIPENNGGYVKVTAPAWSWIFWNGRGFLCSTEW